MPPIWAAPVIGGAHPGGFAGCGAPGWPGPGSPMSGSRAPASSLSAAARARCSGSAFACDSIATPACCSTWARDSVAVSEAKSASMIRLRAADWFSVATCRVEITFSKRFWAAPNDERAVLTCEIAKSIARSRPARRYRRCRPSRRRSRAGGGRPAGAHRRDVDAGAGTADATAPSLVPGGGVAPVMFTPLIETWSSVVALAPIWKSNDVVVVSTAWPLKRVVSAVRVISSCSWLNSFCSASRSLWLLVALVDCTASSRMRCSMSPILPSDPLGRLGQRDRIVGVALGNVHAAHLGVHAFGDRQTRRIVLGAVDAQAGGQTLDRLRQHVLRRERFR
jgi:hypothetical protein